MYLCDECCHHTLRCLDWLPLQIAKGPVEPKRTAPAAEFVKATSRSAFSRVAKFDAKKVRTTARVVFFSCFMRLKYNWI